VARDVQRRPESGVLRFRIERHDASGNRLTPVPVEMLGTSFFGKVSNGDEIHLKGKLRHGTLRADYIGNLTTGAEVRGGCAGAVLKPGGFRHRHEPPVDPDATADPHGRYPALCGLDVLPAALVDPGTGYCWDCRSSIPGPRSR
jgi:hypothetical protein